MAPNTLETAVTALNHLEKLINPQKLTVLTSEVLSKFQSKLRATGMKETSIATQLRHLRAALSWGVSLGMLPKMPDFHMPKRVGRVVSAIGKKAGVVVNKAEGKYASAHDLRRSFGTRWSGKVKPATLQLLMRHKSIETTLKYYVAQDADDVADELWAAHDAAHKNNVRGAVRRTDE